MYLNILLLVMVVGLDAQWIDSGAYHCDPTLTSANSITTPDTLTLENLGQTCFAGCSSQSSCNNGYCGIDGACCFSQFHINHGSNFYRNDHCGRGYSGCTNDACCTPKVIAYGTGCCGHVDPSWETGGETFYDTCANAGGQYIVSTYDHLDSGKREFRCYRSCVETASTSHWTGPILYKYQPVPSPLLPPPGVPPPPPLPPLLPPPPSPLVPLSSQCSSVWDYSQNYTSLNCTWWSTQYPCSRTWNSILDECSIDNSTTNPLGVEYNTRYLSWMCPDECIRLPWPESPPLLPRQAIHHRWIRLS